MANVEKTRLEELLPDRWAATHPEYILAHRFEESHTKTAAKRDRRRHRAFNGKRPR